MNPQYMQQQRPLYGPPPPNGTPPPPYSELNANLPQKGSYDLHSLPPQKPPLAPTPTSNAPPATRPPHYAGDAQGQASDIRHGPPLSHSNQNNLADQMSGIALSGQQRLPLSHGLPPQSEKSAPSLPFPSAVNGVSNQNHYPPQGITTSLKMSTMIEYVITHIFHWLFFIRWDGCKRLAARKISTTTTKVNATRTTPHIADI